MEPLGQLPHHQIPMQSYVIALGVGVPLAKHPGLHVVWLWLSLMTRCLSWVDESRDQIDVDLVG